MVARITRNIDRTLPPKFSYLHETNGSFSFSEILLLSNPLQKHSVFSKTVALKNLLKL